MRIITCQYSKRGPWYWFIRTNRGNIIPGLLRYVNKNRAYRSARNYIKRNQRRVFG